MDIERHDDATETDDAKRQRLAAEAASFRECVTEVMAWFDREQIDALAALVRPGGVRIPHGVWEAVRRDVGAERFTELITHDRPALLALVRETWRAQRQAEEVRTD